MARLSVDSVTVGQYDLLVSEIEFKQAELYFQHSDLDKAESCCKYSMRKRAKFLD